MTEHNNAPGKQWGHGSGCATRNTLREGDCDCTAGPHGAFMFARENERLTRENERLRKALTDIGPECRNFADGCFDHVPEALWCGGCVARRALASGKESTVAIPGLMRLGPVEAPGVQRSEYVSADGLRIVLEVPEPPMGSGSGYLPPPVIEFWRGGPVPFTYQGDVPAPGEKNTDGD